MIKVKRASWRDRDESSIGFKYDITTIVLKQKGIYFDPSDSNFLDKIFKEYVRRFLKKEKVILKLSKLELFFYGENANVYLLNYIYNDFFPNRSEKPFNPILKSDEGSINLSLFNGTEEQVVFLIEILDKMKIDFKKLSKKYMLLPFPHSLEYYGEDRVCNVRYEKWNKNYSTH